VGVAAFVSSLACGALAGGVVAGWIVGRAARTDPALSAGAFCLMLGGCLIQALIDWNGEGQTELPFPLALAGLVQIGSGALLIVSAFMRSFLGGRREREQS
jgi:hypothetical protein